MAGLGAREAMPPDTAPSPPHLRGRHPQHPPALRHRGVRPRLLRLVHSTSAPADELLAALGQSAHATADGRAGGLPRGQRRRTARRIRRDGSRSRPDGDAARYAASPPADPGIDASGGTPPQPFPRKAEPRAQTNRHRRRRRWRRHTDRHWPRLQRRGGHPAPGRCRKPRMDRRGRHTAAQPSRPHQRLPARANHPAGGAHLPRHRLPHRGTPALIHVPTALGHGAASVAHSHLGHLPARPGTRQQPSREYLAAARDAIDIVAEREQKRSR